MPGNDFEKQVQQKMDELKFAPSDTVWHQVEKQINERRKRRLPFLWLVLLAVLLGGATWLYTINNNMGEKPAGRHLPAEQAVASRENSGIEKNNTTIPGTGASVKKTDANPPAAMAAAKNKAIEPSNAVKASRPENAAVPVPVKETAAAVTSTGTTRSTIAPVHNTKPLALAVAAGKKRHSTANLPVDETGIAKNKSRQHPHKLTTEKPAAIARKPVERSSMQQNEEVETGNSATEHIATADNITATQANAPANAIVTDTIAAVSASAVVADSSMHKDAVSTPLLAEKKPAGKKKKNIQWGFSASLGGSNISQKISGAVSDVFSASTAYSVAADRNNAQSIPGNVGNNNNGNLNPFTRPGALKPGISYSLNLFVSKPLGNHFKLMAGLGYSYYSMGLEVGSKIDSNKALLQFSNGNSGSYTNRFHFIELPVTIQKQLGKTSRFSIDGGLALSFLAGSNALQYSSSKNIYFKDNSNINKIQLGLMAGANYRFLQKSFVMEAGPQLRYGLSNILNKETYGNMHLFFAGINARVYFNRNKR